MPRRPPLPSDLALLECSLDDFSHDRFQPLLIRWRDLCRIVGKTRSCIYRDMHAGRFPKPVKTGAGTAVAWRFEDLEEWMHQLPLVDIGGGQRNAVK